MVFKQNIVEDIVVSGISGKFPESDTVDEFIDNLYANKDLIVEDERRWPFGFLGLPKGSGKLKDISKFDANFFGISETETHMMDAQIRIMLELTYEAIWDSGIDPNSLSGSNTGTFIGNCFDEAPSAQAEDYSKIFGYKQHFAGRLAQIFNFSGPSMVVDTACASSFCALHEAMCSLRSNRCDKAIVVGINMSLRATTQLQFYKLNMISPEGHCKCLDSDANGYAKGEACVVIVLQKKSETKRIYATVVHTKTNTDGFKELGITFPSSTSQRDLMIETYAEAKINPNHIKYVEAHCTGTQAGDPVEMSAIVDAMCSERSEPLLIGALKSIIGHTEGSSGLCSLTKVIFSLENESIPANLHMKTPNPKIDGLMSGILKPITTNTPFKDKLVGLNCFGFGGVNVHVIVRSDSTDPSVDDTDIFAGIPRLVLMCGRTEDGLNSALKKLLKTPKMLTKPYLSLLNDISKTSAFKNQTNGFQGMSVRGYALKNQSNTSDEESDKLFVSRTPETRPQIWYVFSGMGSQWPAMAKTLMSLNVFAQSIKKSAQLLNQFNCDLMTILLDTNPNLMNCPLNSFISLAAIQIGLVDVLNELDIIPDGIIGHSIGELVCAYADGCLTQEETLTMAYWRGKCVKDELKCKGRMAAIGLSLSDVRERLPHNVFTACHNSEDSVTVSGEESAVNSFVKQLYSENIFARNVDSTGIAFHSPLMSHIRNPLIQKLSQIIPTKRERSSKWLSTTYNVSDETSQYLSADYFADNLILPVLFEDVLKHIPKDAVVVEVSAHHLLQPILKKSLGFDMTYIPLMKKNGNNIEYLLESIGKLYATGVNPSIEKLYPKVEYPVPKGTPTISPLVKWEHNQSYNVYQYPHYFNPIGFSDFAVKLDLQDKEDSYLSGHCIDGRVLYPATGYLLLVWKQLAKQLGVNYEELPVEFENVRLHRATILPKVGVTKFDVRILETSGEFVIKESATIAVTGRIFVPQIPFNRFKYLLDEELNKGDFFDEEKDCVLKTGDIYKELRLRGYDYGKSFQCLTNAQVNSQRTKATIKCINWVSFADSMIQMAILGKKSRGLYLPVRIDSLRCDPKELMDNFANLREEKELPVLFDNDLGIGVTKGLEFRGVKANLGPRKVFARIPLIEEYRFVPNDEDCSLRKSSQTECFNQYLKQCYELALNLIKKFNISVNSFESFDKNFESIIKAQAIKEKTSDAVLNNDDSTDTNDSKDHCLLQLLMELNSIENNIIDEKKLNQLNGKLLDLESDLLNKCFQREDFLRQQLDTVIENSLTNNRINVLEVSQSQTIIAQTVIELIRLSSFDVKISYNLLHPMVNKLNSDLINDVECHQWVVEKSRLPPELNNYELILYEDRVDLLLSKLQINYTSLFESLWNSVKTNGFLIVFHKSCLSFAEEVLVKLSAESQNDNNNNNNKKLILTNEYLTQRKNKIIAEAEKVGFTLIATKIDGFSKNSMIFRKVCADITVENQMFIRISNDKCDQWIENLKNSLKTIDKRPDTENIWLVGDGSPTNGIIGLVNCLRKETNGHRIRCIFQYDFNRRDDSNILNKPELLANIVEKNLVMNVLTSDYKSGSFRHFSIDSNQNTIPAEHCYLNVQTKGDLSSFKWFEAQHKYWPLGKADNEQLIDVFYSPLNFRDIMLATGKLSADALPDDMGLQDCILGLEFSGRDQNGNRVMGMTPSKGLATTIVMQDMDFVWPIPQHWSMEEASTVPVVYATAYYALIIRGKLKPRESVLIHSGSGGVGQAAIAICLSMECQLFITCGSDSKRQFLKKEFSPKLSDKNFLTSRDSSFEWFVMRQTNGRGVDLVLNSLSEEKLQSSVRCLATGGRFLEIGKYDLSQNNELGLSTLLRNKTFHGILLDSLFVDESKCSRLLKSHKRLVRQLIENGINDGTVRPLKTTVFDSSQVEQAFRFMASGKHIGKVVLKIKDENEEKVSVRFPSVPRTVFKPNKCYIIIGGLGGFGLELANWMIERGAMNLILTSRSGLKTPYQRLRIKHFEDIGVNVRISTKNVSILSEAQDLIEMANKFGTSQGLAGIFNLALVLCDGLFENQTTEQFEKVMASKAQSVNNLDVLSRNLSSKLDYFVCFSSVSCGRGNSGQTNYGFANSVMERVCEQRRSIGLSGLAIQWGAIGDVGVVAESMGGNDISIGGTLPQRMPSCLATLDCLLQSNHSVVSSIVKADHKIEASNKKGNLIKTIAHILGLKDYMNLDSNLTLAELGMDSLMSVEVKQTLERDYELVLSMQDIRRLNISQIAAIGQKSQTKSQTEIQIPDLRQSSNDLTIEIPVESVTHLNDVKTGKPVLLLPPLEGSFRLLVDLAKLLNRPVIGLNWTNNCQNLKTIEETAKYYLNVINDELKTDSFDLMGYSFGGCVAYEMAVQLQKSSSFGNKLIFLDSSPIQFSIYAEEVTRKYQFTDEKTRELESLIAFLNQYVSIDYQKVKQILENTPTDQRVDRVSQIFLESQRMETNPQNIEFIAKTFSNKLLMLNTYNVGNGIKFIGDSLLIRAEDVIIKNEELIRHDYGLSQIICGNCETVVMNGNHLSFLGQNIEEISTLVNNYLDK